MFKKVVYYDNLDGVSESREMQEFDYLFDRIGDCKYPRSDILKMKFEVCTDEKEERERDI